MVWWNSPKNYLLPLFSYCFSLISVETLGGQGEFIKTHSKEVKEKLLRESRCMYTRLLNKCRCPENGEFYRDKSLCRLIKETKPMKWTKSHFLFFPAWEWSSVTPFLVPVFYGQRNLNGDIYHLSQLTWHNNELMNCIAGNAKAHISNAN